MPIRPMQLKGHDRPLAAVKFNRDSDLLFTCGKEGLINAWYTENGERLGTFQHDGAVTNCDISSDSKFLISSSADRSMRYWDAYTGEQLVKYEYDSVVNHVSFSADDSLVSVCVKKSPKGRSQCAVYATEDLKVKDELRLIFHPNNDHDFVAAFFNIDSSYMFLADDAGKFYTYDVNSDDDKCSMVTQKFDFHTKPITNMVLSKDKTMLLLCSKDMTATLLDVRDPQDIVVLKEYKSDRPLNACAISPLLNHILLAGGQDANDVTLTSSKDGHFEVDFWHIFYQERLDSVKGHFGPVNAVAFSTDGKMFASGGEDGYVRLYHFDQQYLSNTY